MSFYVFDNFGIALFLPNRRFRALQFGLYPEVGPQESNLKPMCDEGEHSKHLKLSAP